MDLIRDFKSKSQKKNKTREKNGYLLFMNDNVQKITEEKFIVASQSDTSLQYVIYLLPHINTCICKFFFIIEKVCKHIYAARNKKTKNKVLPAAGFTLESNVSQSKPESLVSWLQKLPDYQIKKSKKRGSKKGNNIQKILEEVSITEFAQNEMDSEKEINSESEKEINSESEKKAWTKWM